MFQGQLASAKNLIRLPPHVGFRHKADMALALIGSACGCKADIHWTWRNVRFSAEAIQQRGDRTQNSAAKISGTLPLNNPQTRRIFSMRAARAALTTGVSKLADRKRRFAFHVGCNPT
jgi:hypothetical protein